MNASMSAPDPPLCDLQYTRLVGLRRSLARHLSPSPQEFHRMAAGVRYFRRRIETICDVRPARVWLAGRHVHVVMHHKVRHRRPSAMERFRLDDIADSDVFGILYRKGDAMDSCVEGLGIHVRT